MPREILTDWTTPAGGGFRSVTYWHLTPSVDDQRQAWNEFLIDISTILDDGTDWNVQTTGREMDDATGVLTGEWSDATVQSGGGAGAGETVPDASQMLIRWNTGEIVNGRFLKGRTFIPGVQVAGLASGNLSPANVDAVNAAAVTPPLTVSLSPGAVVPMPTLPAEVIRIFSPPLISILKGFAVLTERIPSPPPLVVRIAEPVASVA